MDDKQFKLEYALPMTDAEIKAIVEKDGDCKINIEYLTVRGLIEGYSDLLTEEQINTIKNATLDKN